MTIILIILFFVLLAFAPVHVFLQIDDDFTVGTRTFLAQAIFMKIQRSDIQIIPSCFVKEKIIEKEDE